MDRLAALSDAQIELLADVCSTPHNRLVPETRFDFVCIQVRELYRERATLEREHAVKLQALAKKASDRKARRAAALVVGDEPTKAWDEGTVRRRSAPFASTALRRSEMRTARWTAHTPSSLARSLSLQ